MISSLYFANCFCRPSRRKAELTSGGLGPLTQGRVCDRLRQRRAKNLLSPANFPSSGDCLYVWARERHAVRQRISSGAALCGSCGLSYPRQLTTEHLSLPAPTDRADENVTEEGRRKVASKPTVLSRLVCVAAGDAITVDSTAYTVRVIQPEDTGIITLILGK